MSRAYNFSSGPGAIPEPVLAQARDEMLEWSSARASVMEISHRGKHFIALAEEAETDLRALMAVPANYKVLFLQGGATQHFAQMPMNFAGGASAGYVVTGQCNCDVLSLIYNEHAQIDYFAVGINKVAEGFNSKFETLQDLYNFLSFKLGYTIIDCNTANFQFFENERCKNTTPNNSF